MPTPVGVFRDVERASYGDLLQQQIARAQDGEGGGDLQALLTSGAVWEVPA